MNSSVRYLSRGEYFKIVLRHNINIEGASDEKIKSKTKTMDFSTAMLATSQLAYESYIEIYLCNYKYHKQWIKFKMI